MKVLLDTHAFLWSITGDDRLSKTAEEIFLDPDNNLFFSAASFWEICIKMNLGKLSLKRGWFKTIQEEMRINAVQWLPVEMRHCVELTKLPFHHRDPFDRMLIAQAMVADLQLLSRDGRLSAYEINRIW
ncbi:MAG: type II toxin-antitoxin system VapC family toxin [Desulfobacteraceae bacterium]|jgi:PIN domain nuclease of toxin-antitoxin system|nr:type II toxin-antitoxin system VapC family toxin [Desulfobacteraceae bacterium]